MSLTTSQQSSGDYWDDDWDDDSEVGQTQAYAPSNYSQPQQTPLQSSHPGADYNDTISMQGIHSVIPDRNIPNVPKKNTKFSTLIKSSEDNFLLGTKVIPVPENEKVFIEEKDGRCTWVPTGEAYNCVITSPKKESKLKGLKSFIVYQLTPTVIIYFSSKILMKLKTFYKCDLGTRIRIQSFFHTIEIFSFHFFFCFAQF